MGSAPATPPPPLSAQRLLALLALLLAIHPAFFWRGGVLDEEIPGLLRKNWSDASFLQKVFDPRGWDFYQGRELSYAIDCLDAQWVRLLLAHDWPWFVPPSGVLAALAFVAIGAWLAPRALPSLSATARWLVLLVLLSNFAVQASMGLLYRATKPLVAPLTLALALLLLGEQRRPRLGRRSAFAAVGAAALVICLLDRQGLFYALVLALGSGVAWWLTRRLGAHLLGLLAALAAWFLYFRLLAPRLVQALNGYWPSFRFQRLRPERLFVPQLWQQAADVVLDWTSLLLAGIAPALLLAAAAGFALFVIWRLRPGAARLAGWAGCLAAVAGLQLLMAAMMVERHPAVTWPGNRVWYYPLPYQAWLTFFALWGLDALAQRRGGSLPRFLPLLLAAVAIANVARWPQLRALMDADPPFHEQFRRSEAFVRSFRDGSPSPGLDGAHRRFYFECLARFPRLQARALPQVGEGEGVSRAELRDGRLTAWAEHDAQLVAWQRDGGRYRLSGGVRLRAGDSLRLLLDGRLPRLLAEIRRDEATAGSEPISLLVDLPAGPAAIRLLSSLPGETLPRSARAEAGAFELELPFTIAKERPLGAPPPTPPSTPSIDSPRGSR